MTFTNLIKQPWFQIIVGVVVVILIGFGIYFYGKSQGRTAHANEFDARQKELLKKSNDALALADAAQARALNSETYAAKLKEQIGKDRQVAQANAARIEEVYKQEELSINEKYEAKKQAIMSGDGDACASCTDLCRSTNSLTVYGPEFANYRCDPVTDCAFACNP